MKFFEKVLIISILFVWLGVFFKYEYKVFASRGPSPSGNTASNSRVSGGSSGSNSNSIGSSGSGDSAVSSRTGSSLSRSSSSGSDRSGISHRLRQGISNTLHRIENKILHPKPVVPVVPVPVNPPYYNPPSYNPPYSPQVVPVPPFIPYSEGSNIPSIPAANSNPGGFGNMLKTASGSFVLSKLAKKIIGSGKHHGSSHDYYNGNYNGYDYRPDNYRVIEGAMCKNNVNYDGVIYGQFRCPVDGFDYTATLCCGEPFEEYCCNAQEKTEFNRNRFASGGGSSVYDPYNDQFYQNRKKNNTFGMIIGIIIAVSLIFCIICGICMFVYCKKRITEK